jgi:hypothetical protein
MQVIQTILYKRRKHRWGAYMRIPDGYALPLEWITSWKDWNSSKIQELKTLTVWSILWKQLSSINAISQLNFMLAASLRSVGTGPMWQLYSFWISKHSIIM